MPAKVLAILAVGALVTLGTMKLGSWGSFGAALLASLALITVADLLYDQYRILFLPVHAIATGALLFPVLMTMRFAQRERRERWIREAFGAMVSPEVLSHLEQRARAISASAVKRRRPPSCLSM